MSHFADRLFAAVEKKGAPVCVGIDPVLERMPANLARQAGEGASNCAAAAGVFAVWTRAVLEVIQPYIPVVQFQSACFERHLFPGVQCMWELIQLARSKGFIVILDAKRGDIGASSAHYAAGNLADQPYMSTLGGHGPDALTVSPYMGDDSLQPFVACATEQGKGLFVLVRTSNAGGDRLQALALADGRRVCDAVADLVAELGGAAVGESGYSGIGAVVGATQADEIADLRRRMPRQVFLLPGYGAQGGGAADVKPAFDAHGRGALVTASRSVIYAYESDTDDQPRTWTAAVEAAAIRFRNEIAAVVGSF